MRKIYALLMIVLFFIWSSQQVMAQSKKEIKDSIKQESKFYDLKFNNYSLNGDALFFESGNSYYKKAFLVKPLDTFALYKYDETIYTKSGMIDKMGILREKYSESQIDSILYIYLLKSIKEKDSNLYIK